MSLPLFKLGTLLVKQLSKPLGKMIKDRATQHEKVRNYIVMPIGRVYHNIDLTLRMRILGLGKPDTVPQLTDAKAIELGGELLAECIVFGTGIAIVMIEYWRSSSKAAHKEVSDDQKILRLEVEQSKLILKLNTTTNILKELEGSLKQQVDKTEELNKKYERLIEKNKVKSSPKASQTTEGRQVGKIIIPSKSVISAQEDVTNSIVYQCADEAANELRFSRATGDKAN